MKIGIFGTGNIGTVFGTLLKKSGHEISFVYGRTAQHVTNLAAALETKPINSMEALPTTADLWIIAVSDSALATLIEQLPGFNGVVVHTAGSISQDVFKGKFDRYGILYPYQSTRKEREPYAAIPIFINGSSKQVLELLRELAASWAHSVTVVSDEKRLEYHLAAIVANNFTNYILIQLQDFMAKKELSFDLVMPLLQETLDRLKLGEANTWQTGPAIRKDEVTIQKHLELIKNEERLQHLYMFLTNEIKSYFKV